MKRLRIGNEYLKVAKATPIKPKCELGHPMQKVVTEGDGTFEYCATCNSTRRISDPE